jgi:hypothetical protein
MPTSVHVSLRLACASSSSETVSSPLLGSASAGGPATIVTVVAVGDGWGVDEGSRANVGVANATSGGEGVIVGVFVGATAKGRGVDEG